MFISDASAVDGKQRLSGKDVTAVLKATFDVEQLHRIAADKISQISGDAANGIHKLSSLDEALAALRSLPLTQSDYDRASKWLHNAWEYFQDGELNPGHLELNLLEKSLKNAV